MKSIARWCFLHRWIVVALWIAVLVGLGGLNGALGSHFKDDFNLPDTDSKKAITLLQDSFPAQSGDSNQIVLHIKQGNVDDPAVRASVERMLQQVRGLPYVKQIDSPYADDKRASHVSKDKTIAFADMQLDVVGSKFVPIPDVKNIIKAAQAIDSPSIEVELAGGSIQSANPQGFGLTEVFGFLFAAIILFLAFGSIYTMFLPLLTAVLALGTSISVVGLLTHTFSVTAVAPELAALIGIGVGVDYALFIVSRHRTNLQQGMEIEQSVITAINTSGRAVLFAGVTVCIGLLGLFLLGVTFLYGMAAAAIIAVIFTMLAAITFLPAMLGFVGMKALNKKQRAAIKQTEGAASFQEMSPKWYAWSKFIQRNRWVTGTLALIVVVVLAIPVFHIRLGSTDAGGDPKDTTTRMAYDLLAQGFGPGFNGPLQLVAEIHQPGDLSAFADLTKKVSENADVAVASPPLSGPKGDVAVSIVYPKTSPQDVATSDLIKDLRKHTVPDAEKGTTLQTHIGGQTAIFQDFSQVLSSKYPLFFSVIIGLAFLLLMAVFRSIVIPLTASVMNVLAAGAAFGLVVAVFQWGWLSSVFGIDYTGPIQAFLPVIVFSIVFGLSMDYEVFLVSRMHEEWVHSHDNAEAISLGQAGTGRVITAAASIMVFVFGTFIFGGQPTIKLFGLGLAGAIFIDAALIRTILVPSAMHIFGRANWWLPGWLDKALPTISVEAHDSPEAPVVDVRG